MKLRKKVILGRVFFCGLLAGGILLLFLQITMAQDGQGGSKRKAPDDEGDDDIVYVNFSIRGQEGRQLYYKLNRDTKFIKAFINYCERLNLEYETLQFLYDGSAINGKRQSPRMLNMEDGAEILAARHQTGGGIAALNF